MDRDGGLSRHLIHPKSVETGSLGAKCTDSGAAFPATGVGELMAGTVLLRGHEKNVARPAGNHMTPVGSRACNPIALPQNGKVFVDKSPPARKRTREKCHSCLLVASAALHP